MEEISGMRSAEAKVTPPRPGKSLTGWKRTSSGEAELRRGEGELCCEGSISLLNLGILGGSPLESYELSREKRNFVHLLIF